MNAPDAFRVLPWSTDVRTIDPLGSYSELYWAPILHPATYLLGRRLVILAEDNRVSEGGLLHLHAVDLAAAIGILPANVTGSPAYDAAKGLGLYRRAMRRLDRYHLISITREGVYVRTAWPRLPYGLLEALTLPARVAEPEQWEQEFRAAEVVR